MKFTVVTNVTPRIAGKKIGGFNTETGEIHFEPTKGGYTSATFETVEVASIDDLADVLAETREEPGRRLLLSGVAPIDSGRLKAGAEEFQDGVGGRIKENFTRPAGEPGLLVFDCDPEHPEGGPWTYEALRKMWRALGLPAFGHVWLPSSSSHLHRTDTGEELRGLRGSHTYLPIVDGSDAKRALRALYFRAVLLGYATPLVTPSANISIKTPFDGAMAGGWQPVYSGGSWIRSGVQLAQSAFDDIAIVVEGDALDTRALVPDLTEAEDVEMRRVQNALRATKSEEAAAVRRGLDAERFRETALFELGDDATEEAIEARVSEMLANSAMKEGTQGLPRSFQVETPDGDTITIGELMDLDDDDPILLAWDGAIVADPLSGYAKAGKLYLTDRNGDRPRCLHTCARGGQTFTFGNNADRLRQAVGEIAELRQLLEGTPGLTMWLAGRTKRQAKAAIASGGTKMSPARLRKALDGLAVPVGEGF